MERCPFCGREPAPPASFCHECGRELATVKGDAANAPHAGVLDRLRREKERLSSELAAFRKLAADRSLTAAESRSWKAIRTAWQEVAAELTRELDAVAPRRSGDRRSGTDRRCAERRVGQQPIDDSAGEALRRSCESVNRARTEGFAENRAKRRVLGRIHSHQVHPRLVVRARELLKLVAARMPVLRTTLRRRVL